MKEDRLDIYEGGNEFLRYIFGALGNHSFLTSSSLDHICYRTENEEEYFELKNKLSKKNFLLSANQVNGREISIFELPNYFSYSSFQTNILELTQPKKGRKDKSGFEHIELIIDLDLRKLIEQNPHLNFNTKNIDDSNSEIRLNFMKGSIKIRNKGIKAVLESEK